jgi:DNA invertase Pin-like site-specific DNA recombinase
MRIEIHHYIHHHSEQSDLLKLIRQTLNIVSNMPTKEEFRAAIDEIKSAADNIAADIDRLAQQAEGGLSAADATAFVDELRSVGANLRSVADKNPEAPAPEA